MSALGEYVNEVKYRKMSLDDASDRDHVASVKAYETTSVQRAPGYTRRIWTRQDKNRAALERFLSDNPDINAPDHLYDARQDRRVARFLRRYRDHKPIVEWQRRALIEAQQLGTYSVVSPLLEVCTKAYTKFLNHADSSEWPENLTSERLRNIRERLDRAVESIEVHVPADEARVTGEEVSSGGNEKKRAGRTPSKAIQKRNGKIIEMDGDGKSVDEICERFPKVTAANARKIISRHKKANL